MHTSFFPLTFIPFLFNKSSHISNPHPCLLRNINIVEFFDGKLVKILQNENPDAPPLKVGIGENEKRLFLYLERHERVTVREFGRLVNISDRRASRILVQLVRAGVIRIHTYEKDEFFTLAYDVRH